MANCFSSSVVSVISLATEEQTVFEESRRVDAIGISNHSGVVPIITFKDKDDNVLFVTAPGAREFRVIISSWIAENGFKISSNTYSAFLFVNVAHSAPGV